jgi:hypothetical protein
MKYVFQVCRCGCDDIGIEGNDTECVHLMQVWQEVVPDNNSTKKPVEIYLKTFISL